MNKEKQVKFKTFIAHNRPFFSMSTNFINVMIHTSKTVYESEYAPVELRAHALDTHVELHRELAYRN